jgi:hypothetical protein
MYLVDVWLVSEVTLPEEAPCETKERLKQPRF